MKFKVDENLPIEVSQVLKRAAHDATTVHEQNLTGTVDESIAAVCQREGRIIITLDTDFADIRLYPPQNLPGIVVLRLQHQDKPHVLSVVERVLQAFRVESPESRLWIVDEMRIRVRS